ncbi:MAG TPA: NosD domain-containing protein, partial [Methanothrix sp.]|nr:NosD domain-containing protein [Methanothrix sp.]
DVETPRATPAETRWIGIAVLSDGNTISNNAITGCKGNGLELSRSNGNTIQGNRISNNGLDGISLSGSSDNILSSNSVTENGMNGLYLQDSDNNIIRGSLFLNNKLEGILLINSNGNLIVDNVYDRIREENSKNNIINGNKLMTEVDISGNIDINIDEPEPPGPKPPEPFPDDDICYILVHPGESIQKAINRICPGGIIEILSGTYPETLRVDKAGIVLRGIGEVFPVVSGNGVDSTIALISSEVLIENLVVTESGNPHAGIDISGSDALVIGCRIEGNKGYGISVSSDGSIIAQNTIEGNGLEGIILTNCTGNMIFLNNFNNAANARDSDLGNQWNSREAISYSYYSRDFSLPLGNYWSDYSGSDGNCDGVGDKPYNLPGGSASKDMHPLIKSWPFLEQDLCISGYKVDGCTDEGIADWEIILKDSNGDEVNRTTTNETGYYEFCDLDPGKYNLSEPLKPGWKAGSSPGTVTLDCENVINQNFTNFGLVCISGYKVDGCTDEGIAD